MVGKQKLYFRLGVTHLLHIHGIDENLINNRFDEYVFTFIAVTK